MDEALLCAIDGTDAFYDEVVKAHLDRRHIIINENISDALLESVCMNILLWNTEDKDLPSDKRKKIYIYINSDGGECVMGAQILSIIQQSKTPVITVGFAKCSSMASYILAAGKERYCFENTVVLCHDGSTSYATSGNKGKDIQKFFDKLDERQNEFMLQNTKMTAEFLEEIKDREYYMFAPEAKERGVVDKIIGVDCDIDEIL